MISNPQFSDVHQLTFSIHYNPTSSAYQPHSMPKSRPTTYVERQAADLIAPVALHQMSYFAPTLSVGCHVRLASTVPATLHLHSTFSQLGTVPPLPSLCVLCVTRELQLATLGLALTLAPALIFFLIGCLVLILRMTIHRRRGDPQTVSMPGDSPVLRFSKYQLIITLPREGRTHFPYCQGAPSGFAH